MKAAFFVLPHIGGTYGVYRALRDGLADRGVALRWVAVGADAAKRLEGVLGRDDAPFGELVAPEEADERRQASALAAHLARHGYDLVVVNALSDRAPTNLARYLPPHVLRLLIVHNVTPGTYAAAAAVRDHVHATIAVSPRIREDLVAAYGFRPDRVQVVANAIDVDRFAATERRDDETWPLRLLTLGRVEDASKGVFWLPDVMDRLSDVPARLSIGGPGPDLERLRARCARLGDRVRFLGPVSADRVPAVMAEHDILLFPSRYEGFGLTLAEAMAAGCAPVASRIAGVTDFVVEDGRAGLLFPVGDVRSAAQAVRRLASDRALLRDLSRAGRLEAARRFRREDMARAYAEIVERLRRDAPPIAAPLPLSAWSYPRGLRPGLRSHAPEPIKNLARELRERLRGLRSLRVDG